MKYGKIRIEDGNFRVKISSGHINEKKVWKAAHRNNIVPVRW